MKNTVIDGKVRISDVKIRISDGKVRISDGKVRISDVKIRISDVKIRISGVKVRISDVKVRISDVKPTHALKSQTAIFDCVPVSPVVLSNLWATILNFFLNIIMLLLNCYYF
jgi:hypothetical protein